MRRQMRKIGGSSEVKNEVKNEVEKEMKVKVEKETTQRFAVASESK